MTFNPVKLSTVQAVTCEVLPITGLAYLMDEENRTWTLTRQAAGTYFDKLRPGTTCQLSLEHYLKFPIVGRCDPVPTQDEVEMDAVNDAALH